MTAKEQEFGTFEHLVDDFQSKREKLSRHIFNIRHQYKVLKSLRDHLSPNAAVLHIDFSENYSCNTLLPKFDIKVGSWNFLEAGHGKGPSDGIGSVIKRTADSLVSKGIKDLPDARSVFEALSELKLDVKLFWVAEEDIAAIDNTDVIPEQIPAVPGTMTVHQVSCFCSGDGLCNCYEVSKVSLKAQKATHQNTTPSAPGSVASDTAPRTVPASHQQHPHRFTPGELTEDMEGKWCMVEYDGVPYPGIIQNVDDGEVEVNVMQKIGDNRYFWPMMNDTLWYRADQLLTLMPPTEKVTGRHQRVCPNIWNEVSKLLDL